MNRISFSGSGEFIRDFVDRFLESAGTRFEPLEETLERYRETLQEIAAEKRIDLRNLEKVVDFMVACDMPEERIERFLGVDDGGLESLARDAGILESYIEDGTIESFSIHEESG